MVASLGCKTTSPELRRCDVRGPSGEGIAGSLQFSKVDCFDIKQFSGILESDETFGPRTRSPVYRVMGDLEGIAYTSWSGSNPVFPRKLQIKDIVHSPCEDHIRINHDHPLVLCQTEDAQLCPRVIESGKLWVESSMLSCCWDKVVHIDDLHALRLDDSPRRSGKLICDHDYQGISGYPSQGVVHREQP
jgi:hypothetical protein